VPQIAIEYSRNLADAFDAGALAKAVHRLIAETIDTDLGNCKTRLVALDDYLIGDGSPQEAMVHVDLRILSGRSDAQKKALGEAVLEAAHGCIGPHSLRIQVTVEVRELDRANYHKRVLAGG
jgi:5-carboxymethyl-2-hydroxymuconate isomerase